jgi:hypothetical protein
LATPDYNQVPSYVDLRSEDRILNAGLSLERFLESKAHFDPFFILDQLPDHEKLVLGGFHQYDCVEKVAKASCLRGVDTFVDEDTTHMFFKNHALHGTPLIREDWSLRGFGYSEHSISRIRKARKGKLYLTQK